MFLDIVLDVLGSLHGGSAYFLLFVLVAAAGVGAPLAQDVLLLAASALTLQGGLQLLPMVVVAWCGVLAGDVLTFFTGHHYGARWVRRPWAARWVPPDCLPAAEALMRRWGAGFCFVTRWLPGQRALLFFVAGTLRLPYRPFLVADAMAAALQLAVLVYGARTLGWRWQALREPIGRADDVLTGLAVLCLLALWLRARRR